MEDKRQHLQFIQDIVSRQANNSFLLRNWAITLVAAILALSSGEGVPKAVAFIAILPIILFWILDGYFLWQERLFRSLYDHVRQLSVNQIDYSMNVGPFIGGRNEWLACMFSKTLIIFYLGMLALAGVVGGLLMAILK